VDGTASASPGGFPIGFVARGSCCGFSFMPWLSRFFFLSGLEDVCYFLAFGLLFLNSFYFSPFRLLAFASCSFCQGMLSPYAHDAANTTDLTE
jgi:hypothetical protein